MRCPENIAQEGEESEDSERYPWNFYRDLTRQLWDEARHAMMGEVGFARMGIDWPKLVMINKTWSEGLNAQLTPKERHAVLWFIEQGLMSKTGKRYEWEVGRDAEDEFAELIQDYDWADEVLHARIGRDWYVRNFERSRRQLTTEAPAGTRFCPTGMACESRASPNTATGGPISTRPSANCGGRSLTKPHWPSTPATRAPAPISSGLLPPGSSTGPS